MTPARSRVRFRPAPLRRPMVSPTPANTADILIQKIGEFQKLYTEIKEGIALVRTAHVTFQSVKKGDRGMPGTKGDMGRQGMPGTPARAITREEVETAVQKHLQQPKDGVSPEPATVAEHVLMHPKFEKLLRKHLKPGKDGESPATDALVAQVMEQLKGKKVSVADIEGLETKFAEMRGHINSSKEWRGGGDTVVAGTGVTIVNTKNGNKQINATGGSFTVLVPTGTVDGVNRTFVFVTAPNVIALDNGNFMNKVSADGTVNWTGTTTVTLNQAPLFNIFGL